MTEVVAKTSAALVPVTLENMGINPKEIILPMLLLRQPTFKKEHLRLFQPGDILKMPGAQGVAKFKETSNVVPVAIQKQYRVVDITHASQPKGVGYEEWVAGVEWTFEQDGKMFRRDQCYSVFFLLRSDLLGQAEMLKRLANGDVVDPDDFVLPTRVVFARGSFPAGKVIASHFELSKAVGQSPAAMTYSLGSKELTNEHGTWYVFDIAKAPKDSKYTPKEMMPTCDFWVKTLATSAIKVAEDDEMDVVVDAQVKSEADSQY